jgi:alpha-galactosidase
MNLSKYNLLYGLKVKIVKESLMFLLFLAPFFGWSQDKSLPPMGWEPWNIDHCGTLHKWDADFYNRLADFIVSSGLRDLGYRYLTYECHAHYRDSLGHYQSNPEKFPDGIKTSIDYLHSKNLKARAYTDAGTGKCGGCFDGAGSYGHYEEDSKKWAELGFDGVKIDWCGGNDEKLDPKSQFIQFHSAIMKYNPDFNIEICTWGMGEPWNWGSQAGTFWRTSGDIDNVEGNIFKIGGSWKGLLRNIDANRHPDKNLVGPGKGWNYGDMLLVGVADGLNETEEQTQFTMWAIMASPLFLGNDVLNMSQYVKDIVMNREVISIDQDPLGVQGDVIKELFNGNLQVWKKDLADGSKALAVLNRGENSENVALIWNDLGIKGKWKVRDLWQHADKSGSTDRYETQVLMHSAVLLKLSK